MNMREIYEGLDADCLRHLAKKACLKTMRVPRLTRAEKLAEGEAEARAQLAAAAAPIEVQPIVSGIYFLLDGSEVVYVGQSRNVLQRLACHVTEGAKTFDRWCYTAWPSADLTRMEGYYIRLLKPRHNVTGKPAACKG